MNIQQLQEISLAADEALANADQRIGLKPRIRKCTTRKGMQKVVEPKIVKRNNLKSCKACGQPTTNKIFCSRVCVLNSNRSKREYKAMKEATKIKRQNTLREKMKEKAIKICENRNCDKKLNPNKAIAHQRKYCSVSCAAKEIYLKKRDSLIK